MLNPDLGLAAREDIGPLEDVAHPGHCPAMSAPVIRSIASETVRRGNS